MQYLSCIHIIEWLFNANYYSISMQLFLLVILLLLCQFQTDVRNTSLSIKDCKITQFINRTRKESKKKTITTTTNIKTETTNKHFRKESYLFIFWFFLIKDYCSRSCLFWTYIMLIIDKSFSFEIPFRQPWLPWNFYCLCILNIIYTYI